MSKNKNNDKSIKEKDVLKKVRNNLSKVLTNKIPTDFVPSPPADPQPKAESFLKVLTVKKVYLIIDDIFN